MPSDIRCHIADTESVFNFPIYNHKVLFRGHKFLAHVIRFPVIEMYSFFRDTIIGKGAR